ncbi:hypothetical protein BS47DRAFT_1313528 [Hydnum rufescens UP504]|uniref:Mitochondrial inner membrane protease subunit n=1 Tax=Hydnum rufescens UP504 TaxID=1448309 RepID=A0A9P6B6B1_9AGAM|nr:hypothetical protein BS47DRAFT_1313528 [Hydnum rufescens UP504]
MDRLDFRRMLWSGLRSARPAVVSINAVLIWHLVTEHIGSIKPTEGPSMLPTLANGGDWVITDRISHRLTLPKILRHGDQPPSNSHPSLTRGSLISYKSPIDRTRLVCKRLIGLPGDMICINPHSAPASLNDQKSGAARPVRHTVVPANHFWVQGDNLAATLDSQTYGPVPFGLFDGQVRAIVRLWPLEIRRVSNGLDYIDN